MSFDPNDSEEVRLQKLWAATIIGGLIIVVGGLVFIVGINAWSHTNKVTAFNACVEQGEDKNCQLIMNPTQTIYTTPTKEQSFIECLNQEMDSRNCEIILHSSTD